MSASAVFDTYARAPLTVDKGEGMWLTATDGRRFLDFTSGIAASSLGHAHPALVKALIDQAGRIWHSSNAFTIPGQERLAERLAAATFADKVFFANSGAEAIEAAIKTARRYHFVGGNPERNRVLTFSGSFHGRTLATIAAAKNPKHIDGFGPLPDGFDQVAPGDLRAVAAAITPETAGILIEPIQGEGGVRVISHEFLRGLRKLCDDNGILLMLDEVQTGMGRTGKLFAYEWAGIEPDILSVAKGLGGGFPIGACLATADAARGMTAGTHGSTFGGNPLAMAVGNAVLDVLLADGFLEHVRQMGLYFKQRLAGLVDTHRDVVDQVRGEGLLIGLHGVKVNTAILAAFRDVNLLAVAAGDNVVRLLPALIVTEADINEAMARMERAFATLETAPATA